MMEHSTSITPGLQTLQPPLLKSDVFYHGNLPDFIWTELERLYQSIYCSLPHLRLHDSIDQDTRAWIGRRDGAISCILLFSLKGRAAYVINEVITLQSHDLEAFADALFTQHPAVSAVVLKAIDLSGMPKKYLLHRTVVSEDFVLTLPSTDLLYLTNLSRQTREKIRYHLSRSRRKKPGLLFRMVHAPHIDEADVIAVLRMNRARMEKKGKRYGMDALEESRLIALLHERGMLGIMEIDGVISAGLLCSRAGNDVFMHVIAHEPAHDDLRLGFLCCYLTIEAAIREKISQFHFLWGHYDYKTRLGGKEKPLSSLVLFKSRLRQFLHPQILIRLALSNARRTVRQWRR